MERLSIEAWLQLNLAMFAQIRESKNQESSVKIGSVPEFELPPAEMNLFYLGTLNPKKRVISDQSRVAVVGLPDLPRQL